MDGFFSSTGFGSSVSRKCVRLAISKEYTEIPNAMVNAALLLPRHVYYPFSLLSG